ncbi:hypothetical protein VUR80DRAFT_2191 [Thermomyces stellatus]
MFTDVDMPELQLLQDAYLLTFLSCALILKALTELLFPFPGDLARARRTLPLTGAEQSHLPFRLMAEEHIIHDIYERLIQKRAQTPDEVQGQENLVKYPATEPATEP